MNKKTLFLILLLILLPIISFPIKVNALNTPDVIVTKIRDLTVTIGVAVVVIGWVIAGILYLTAAGAPDKIGTAKKALIACVIGTVVVIFADLGYAIINNLLAPIFGWPAM